MTLTLIDSTNYGETFTYDLFPLFETTGGEKCPITNIYYVIKTEVVEINNSPRFSLGEGDVEIQTVDSLNSFYQELFALTNDTLEAA